MLEEVFIPSNHINMVSTMGHLICLDPSSVSRCEGHCRESQICRIRHWSRKAKMKGRLLTCDRFGHFRGLNFLSHAVDVFRYAKFWAHVWVKDTMTSQPDRNSIPPAMERHRNSGASKRPKMSYIVLFRKAHSHCHCFRRCSNCTNFTANWIKDPIIFPSVHTSLSWEIADVHRQSDQSECKPLKIPLSHLINTSY